jgi:1-acyl-sn-glycerol-3-phosphate acyltransferase
MGIGARAAQLWRLLATGFCFAVFGLGGVVLGLLVFPAVRLLSADPERGRCNIQAGVSRSFRVFVWLMKTLGVLTYDVRNVQGLRTRGQLVVANHPTLIDVVLLISLMPEVDCVVKRSLLLNPFLRWPVSWARYIPNSTPQRLVSDCADALRAGRSLIIFPEGTRSVPGQPLQMKRGAAQVALAADADIVPVSIRCEPMTLTKSEPWYRIPAHRPHWTLSVGDAFSARTTVAADCSAPLAARRLTEHFVHYFENGTTRAGVSAPAAARPQAQTTAVPA